jgi:hypothetical protein
MYKTGAFRILNELPRAGALAAVEPSQPVCLACGETPVGVTATACPYCGTAFPQPDPAQATVCAATSGWPR